MFEACHDPGAGNINPEAFELAGNMKIMICLGQGGLGSLSALVNSLISCIFLSQGFV